MYSSQRDEPILQYIITPTFADARVRLVPNQSVNSKYNLISAWIKIPVVAVLVGVVLAGVVAAHLVGVGVGVLLFDVAGKQLAVWHFLQRRHSANKQKNHQNYIVVRIHLRKKAFYKEVRGIWEKKLGTRLFYIIQGCWIWKSWFPSEILSFWFSNLHIKMAADFHKKIRYS